MFNLFQQIPVFKSQFTQWARKYKLASSPLLQERGKGVRSFLLVVLLSSCNLPRNEKSLVAYIADEDHGLTKQQTINGVDVRVTYRPQDFLVKQEIDAGLAKTDSAIEKLKEQYNKQLYFVLSLSKNNQEVLTSVASNKAVFSQMVNNLAFGMGNNIMLITSENDTIELVDFIYPRMYGMSNSTDILLAFKNDTQLNAEYLKFKIADLGLRTGNITFTFKTKDIRKTPTLKLR
jgi:hypothetical protein